MKITFKGFVNDDSWLHYSWKIDINGEYFEYNTGILNATPRVDKKTLRNVPKPKDKQTIIDTQTDSWVHVPDEKNVLECLFMDAEAGETTFHEFCANMGYDYDSRNALNIYLLCQENGRKLRKALGKDYEEVKSKSLIIE